MKKILKLLGMRTGIGVIMFSLWFLASLAGIVENFIHLNIGRMLAAVFSCIASAILVMITGAIAYEDMQLSEKGK